MALRGWVLNKLRKRKIANLQVSLAAIFDIEQDIVALNV